MHTGFDNQNEWDKWIGKKVKKFSNKPFKSGNIVGTVKSLGVNPHSSKPAFLMEEDETMVDCFRCGLIK